MIGNKEAQTLRAAAAIIEQLGWLVKEHPTVPLDELGKTLRKSIETFEPTPLPDGVERCQLIQVLYGQLNQWRKALKREYKSSIANFAEAEAITLLKAATLKKKEDPISHIIANAFDEKIAVSQLKSAINTLQEKGFVVHLPVAVKDTSKKSKPISNDPMDILLNA